MQMFPSLAARETFLLFGKQKNVFALVATEMRLQDTKGNINIYITEWIKYNKHQYYFESGVFFVSSILNKEMYF